MHSQDRLQHLIGLVYDAALDDGRWPACLEALADSIGGKSAVISSGRKNDALTYLPVRVDPAFWSAYTSSFADRDPWLLAARKKDAMRRGFVELGERLVPPGDLRRTEFFAELGRPYNVIGGLGASLEYDGVLGFVGLHQRGFGQFDERDRRFLAALTPHFERALAIRHRTRRAASQQRLAEHVLDQLPGPALLVDGRAKPLLINRAGRQLVNRRNGLLSGREGLITSRPEETQALRTLIAHCAATGRGEGTHPGGTLRVTRRAPDPPLHVLIAPLGKHAMPEADCAEAILFLHDPSARLKIEPATLGTLYGLTPAEARVAALLARGRTVSEICALLGVSPNTVRTHLKRVLQKTQTRTQAQLVHVLLAGLAGLGR